ncbi:hypothetical protein Ctha_0596 [Chloroherpeton thalassium ATCC 35110]|uniref:Uncharacterized protein n=1 Tax=Chloroherpeton thalassium (strain ATCC 35110 / GB-78) TaxID=517418 RepID=B3QVB2_CHLT3|nr:hypothetical protein [Chloroherpeton thalassium]ACF13066.1 hypothetical protein Ctha_0596 [Chloroherpeton thalassium ATCC 35110]
METPETFLTTALGYILKSASQSKALGKAKEELLGHFCQRIRKKFTKAVPELETAPEAPETQAKTETELLELIKDEAFFKELKEEVTKLKYAGIREKNVVRQNIDGVKKIRIGDKTYEPNEPWDKKNIVGGNITNADEFTLGDGH